MEVDVVAEIEAELELPQGFLNNLYVLNDDDWSFIIKIHSFFEALTANLIIQALAMPKLRAIISQIEMSNDRTGKAAFLRELQLLPKDSRAFLASLSEIRNFLAHNPKNVTFNLKAYCSELDNEKKKKFKKTIGYAFDSAMNFGSLDDLFLNRPRILIIMGSLECIHQAYMMKQKLYIKSLRKEIGEVLVDKKHPKLIDKDEPK